MDQSDSPWRTRCERPPDRVRTPAPAVLIGTAVRVGASGAATRVTSGELGAATRLTYAESGAALALREGVCREGVATMRCLLARTRPCPTGSTTVAAEAPTGAAGAAGGGVPGG